MENASGYNAREGVLLGSRGLEPSATSNPSINPSPSVSGLSGSVPSPSSCRLVRLSPSGSAVAETTSSLFVLDAAVSEAKLPFFADTRYDPALDAVRERVIVA